nr:helicase [Tanacetum cinerariifolium]
MSAFTDKESPEGVDLSIVQRLIEMPNQSSSVAKAFRIARNWCHSHSAINVELKLLGERTKAQQYNKPTVAEVATLIINNFGDIIYVIEFQKHGLPHVHILLWLEEHCKCSTPTKIDDIISAEIPCQAEDPEGYKVVTEYMLHEPCGKDAKSAPCNIEENCSKHFPKAFYANTIIDAYGYPIYRRRDNKASTMKGKFKYNKDTWSLTTDT